SRRIAAMGKLTESPKRARGRAERLGLHYAGSLTPAGAWEVLQNAPGARLVDVRTRAELDWVGRVPGAVEIEWMLYPGNTPNPAFAQQQRRAVEPDSLVMVICHSGVLHDKA